ncbi:MAG: 23S rRNA (guanosine(2251)-2'-O)-methyltransferase RlmB [bacterium]|nr:23S rRNA (guanosine(2251)-2'-O)-methyltransferase RlmB [bacterium]
MSTESNNNENIIEQREGWVFGRQPLLEALAAKKTVERIYLADESHGDIIQEIRDAAKGVCPVDLIPRAALDRYSNGIRHQGVAARLASVETIPLDHWLTQLTNGKPVTALMLDGIEDPGNLGAILRSAAVFGADGVIVGERHNAPLSPATAKASAGGMFHVPIVRAKHLNHAIDILKANGFWVFALAEESEQSIIDLELPERIVWVIGGEGSGVSQSLRKVCDAVTAIPSPGALKSLNASVAAAIALYTALTAREAPLE